MWALALGALGVVYGDIGTSPLYAFRECITKPHGVDPSPQNVLGILSLFFWALMFSISLKYVWFVLRADNEGEGGTLSLLSLAVPSRGKATRLTAVLLLVGLAGTALVAGESLITPAISVLSAVEGIRDVAAGLDPFVIPITCGILIALFAVQRRGTGDLGNVFGPVMLVYFAMLTVLGAAQIARYPTILWALHPAHALRFFTAAGDKVHAYLLLGSVVLCITGAEALYADMGHFGRGSIRRAWFLMVAPALVVNYLGQGAYVLSARPDAEAVKTLFYQLGPSWFRIPMIVIATAATVIASQALITGMFSVIRQAIQIGYMPRLRVVHTAAETKGQIYIPFVNYALMVGCVILVLAFKRSGELAAAYGIAVTGTMATTSVLFGVVAVRRFGWSPALAVPLVAAFLAFDLSFFGANLPKFLDGGWFPLVMGTVILTVMTTWKRGRQALADFLAAGSLPIDLFMEDQKDSPPLRVPGTAVFMSSNAAAVPPVLLHHLKHNKVLHKQVVFLSILGEDRPEVPGKQRVQVKDLGLGFFQVVARYGFMQTPNVPEIMERCEPSGLLWHPAETTFYLGRESLLTTGTSGLSRWRKILFAILSRNTPPATHYFGLPPNRVVEMGTQVEL